MMRCLGNSLVIVQGQKQSERKGILLSDSAQEDSNTGEVVAIGPNVQTIDVGDTVLIPGNTYVRIMHTGKFDLMVNVSGEEKPAMVLREDEIQVMWPKGEDPEKLN